VLACHGKDSENHVDNDIGFQLSRFRIFVDIGFKLSRFIIFVEATSISGEKCRIGLHLTFPSET
jgi:hypothetical protein